ncbi:uncharacterized protein BDZ99DRAFT_416215 [Mytilinidion resinicola]|uniref:Large ribosomal subunit protein bL34m n=1 Tax=Mytilinidion resinicola TaxID=574789 RepID=A0A6A6YMI7_9PEZI|nr:uncharacterized protein BDZ99DRAFT_416215 [Mytilinidion resinicola]KAF2810092.1 hypothetical protein BDZ99DRAFT_416215 [Mytilinidion resinicola]
MQSLRCVRLLARPTSRISTPQTIVTSRAFSLLSPRRPQLLPCSCNAITPSTTPSAVTAADGTVLDLLPKISAHPSLVSSQVRCGPRDTFSPSHRVRKRRHGFLARLRSRGGRKILMRRKLKGRQALTH